MSSRRLPTGTVSPPSRGERERPRSEESAPPDSSSGAADDLARENQRLRRENRYLRERLDAERHERQAIIDRYEGLVDDCDAPDASPPSAPSDAWLSSVFDRLARLVGLR